MYKTTLQRLSLLTASSVRYDEVVLSNFQTYVLQRRVRLATVKVKEKFQVTIPTELRKALHLTVGDLLEATIEHDTIVLKPVAGCPTEAWNGVTEEMERVHANSALYQRPERRGRGDCPKIKEYRKHMPEVLTQRLIPRDCKRLLHEGGVSAELLHSAREGVFLVFLPGDILTKPSTRVAFHVSVNAMLYCCRLATSSDRLRTAATPWLNAPKRQWSYGCDPFETW